MDGIKKIVNEIIEGNDKNLPKLRKLVKEFFKGKTQKDFDKIEKRKLQALTKSYERILKEEKLTEIDRAFLDFYFNEKKKKYISLDISTHIDGEKLKKLAIEIHEGKIFGKEGDRDFMSFIGWVWAYDSWWDDIILESEEKDLYFEMVFHHEMKKPEINLFIVGAKKYEYLLEKLSKIFIE